MRYQDMLRGVLSKARGCPEVEAIEQMRYACIEFCTKTRCLTNAAQITTAASRFQPVNLETFWPVDVVDARIDGETVPVLAANDEAVADASAEDPVIVFADPSLMYVLPAPTQPVTVELLLVVAPGQASVDVPDLLWQRHGEALTNGALGRLLAQEGTPWFKAASAQGYGLLFQQAITREAALSGKNRITRARRLRVKPV